MKWTYSIKNKLSASVVLLALCLLVLLSNYLDRIHTKNVKNSVVTLYEDRLIAEDYILKMTRTIYQMREVVYPETNAGDKSKSISKLLNEFNALYTVYIKTQLTPTEKASAMQLIGYIKNMEQKNSDSSYDFSSDTDKALASLNKLSIVQLEESKLIMQNAESEYTTIKTSSQFAFSVIIVLLGVLQAMVFSAKTQMPVNTTKDPSLN